MYNNALATRPAQSTGLVQSNDPIANLLFENLAKARDVIPAHLNPDKLARLALRTIRTNWALQCCTPASLVASIMEAAAFGLEVDQRGLVYLVPYKNECKLMLGYKGLMELAYRSGRVKQIYAETVHERDRFQYEMGLEPMLKHVPNLGDRGEMVGVYAVARMTDVEPAFVVLDRNEIEKVKAASKTTRADTPWNTWTEEMSKKTAIRRLCKYLPLSADLQQAIAIDEAGERGEKQIFSTELTVEEEAPVEPVAALNSMIGAAQPQYKPEPSVQPQPQYAPQSVQQQTPPPVQAQPVQHQAEQPVPQPQQAPQPKRGRPSKKEQPASTVQANAPQATQASTVQPTATQTAQAPTIQAAIQHAPIDVEPVAKDNAAQAVDTVEPQAITGDVNVLYEDFLEDNKLSSADSATLLKYLQEGMNLDITEAKRVILERPRDAILQLEILKQQAMERQ